ncbi:heavy metal-associated domain-containing protein [Hyphomonas sp.]|uniref:heavy-metal-associated domain-containing protein n=1 Tax=Hyphomonas sp. TaxID=87 RepID=UPI0025BE1A1B|nr:heavy metal-associated domain-containing protein [Hyphomonas sp.]
MKLLKTLALAAALSTAPLAALASPETSTMAEPAPGEILMAKVNGLVCDFCAQSIRKIVGKDEAVQKVYVDLSKGQVRVDLKPGESLDDAALEKLIRKAGYSLVSVDRNFAK